MSATIASLDRQAAYVVTDTAVIATDGTVANFMAKVYAVPHANMAIAIRGHFAALPIAVIHLQRAGTTFDEIRANAETVLRPVFAGHNPELTVPVEISGASNDVEITVAGISETRGPLAYQMSVAPTFGIGWRFEEIEGDGALFGPFTSAIEEEFAARPSAGRLADLGWLADQARQIKSPVFGRGDEVSQVGGHTVLTKITKGAIETRILWTWPDRLGERITVHPAAKSIKNLVVAAERNK